MDTTFGMKDDLSDVLFMLTMKIYSHDHSLSSKHVCICYQVFASNEYYQLLTVIDLFINLQWKTTNIVSNPLSSGSVNSLLWRRVLTTKLLCDGSCLLLHKISKFSTMLMYQILTICIYISIPRKYTPHCLRIAFCWAGSFKFQIFRNFTLKYKRNNFTINPWWSSIWSVWNA